MRNIGLQLYTVRHTLAKDFLGTLREVAAIGYRGVEFAGDFGSYAPRALRTILDDLGIAAIGGHCLIEQLNGAFERIAETYAILGARYVGLAWVPASYRNEDGWKCLAAQINQAALTASRYGLTFFYHNHDFEFDTKSKQRGLDLLVAHTDPEHVKFELDVYWATYAGEAPIVWLNKLAGRVPLVHLKDMSSTPDRTFEILGEGIINFEPVFAAGDAAGVVWYVAEQDECPKGELHSARRSYENLARRGWLG
ncbi:MAG: sugar phosphate isomerase/epimerase [Anaerolineae bacterium]|nr:sugar phosphate isomerase/epimerase [Thermoflexales bacterium]MDW8396094.1 sugar phosphate isomerase/epimerase [Anaerolineae bacterium]